MAFNHTTMPGVLGDTLLDCLGSTTKILDPTNSFSVAVITNTWPVSGTYNRDTDQGTYGSGLWTTANGMSTGATPKVLTGVTLTAASGVVALKATGPSMAWSALNETDSGLLVYSTTVSRGVCVIGFGADKAVSGTLTYVPDATYGYFASIY